MVPTRGGGRYGLYNGVFPRASLNTRTTCMVQSGVRVSDSALSVPFCTFFCLLAAYSQALFLVSSAPFAFFLPLSCEILRLSTRQKERDASGDASLRQHGAGRWLVAVPLQPLG